MDRHERLDLKAEALAFPVAAHDDLLDALASAYALSPKGFVTFSGGGDDDEDEDEWGQRRNGRRKSRWDHLDDFMPTGAGLRDW